MPFLKVFFSVCSKTNFTPFETIKLLTKKTADCCMKNITTTCSCQMSALHKRRHLKQMSYGQHKHAHHFWGADRTFFRGWPNLIKRTRLRHLRRAYEDIPHDGWMKERRTWRQRIVRLGFDMQFRVYVHSWCALEKKTFFGYRTRVPGRRVASKCRQCVTIF